MSAYDVLNPTAGRIDYVKFVVELEYDVAQHIFRVLNQAVHSADGCHLREKDNFKISALGATQDGQKRRYAVESWGEHAVELSALVPVEWHEHLSRIDYRQELTNVTAEELDAYITKLQMGNKGRRNISTFDTNYRRKTNTRDVGGKGAFLGSRKSASHTALYRRGGEVPVIETRFINSKAEAIGQQVLQAVDERGDTAWYEALHSAVRQAHAGEAWRATGCSTLTGLEGSCTVALTQMNRVQAAMEWVETEEERADWASLSTEEQTEMQEEGFVPTDMFKPRRRSISERVRERAAPKVDPAVEAYYEPLTEAQQRRLSDEAKWQEGHDAAYRDYQE
jgi:hypothetical protein